MTIKNTKNNLVTTRFAPSPTGYMHIGNARTALFSYLFAQHNNGNFILRVEDTDRERSKKEYVTAILQDLMELGINWGSNPIIYQSQRADLYEEYYQKLQSKNLIYPCFCSEDKLKIVRKTQLSNGLPPRYNGDCLKLTTVELEQKMSTNCNYCWRFKVPSNITIEFDDLIKGRQVFHSNDFGDFIIKRQDGTASFMFCNIIDDVLQGVTHVLRAEDHLSNTPRQLLILHSLGLDTPIYGHFCLLVTNDKKAGYSKLSKRSGSTSIKDLLEQGYLPLALLNYLSRLGHNYVNQENQLLSMQKLSENFDINCCTSNSAKHDLNHLNFWQKQAMLILSEQEFLKILNKNEKFFKIISNKHLDHVVIIECLNLIKNNILMPEEAIYWFKSLFADTIEELTIEHKQILLEIDYDFLKALINALPKKKPEINDFFDVLCQQLNLAGFYGKNLFLNLRSIFTGKTSGPELKKLFIIIGYQRLRKRVEQTIDLKMLHNK